MGESRTCRGVTSPDAFRAHRTKRCLFTKCVAPLDLSGGNHLGPIPALWNQVPTARAPKSRPALSDVLYAVQEQRSARVVPLCQTCGGRAIRFFLRENKRRNFIGAPLTGQPEEVRERQRPLGCTESPPVRTAVRVFRRFVSRRAKNRGSVPRGTAGDEVSAMDRLQGLWIGAKRNGLRTLGYITVLDLAARSCVGVCVQNSQAQGKSSACRCVRVCAKLAGARQVILCC
jgi:hypothetical protein